MSVNHKLSSWNLHAKPRPERGKQRVSLRGCCNMRERLRDKIQKWQSKGQLQVEQRGDEWVVTRDHEVLASFKTNQEAWRYFDQVGRPPLNLTRSCPPGMPPGLRRNDVQGFL
jgi:hypothetical protein